MGARAALAGRRLYNLTMTSPKIPDSLRRVVLASNNAGKLREFSALFAPLGIELVPQGELGVPEPQAHIGRLDPDGCRRVIAAVTGRGRGDG